MAPLHLKSLALDILLPCFFALATDVTEAMREGTTVVIAPHQDDDILSCGAVIAHAKRAGERVSIVFITDGSASSVSSMISPTQLAVMRRAEALQALEVLGCGKEDVLFLDIPDNGISGRVAQVADRLAVHLAGIRPSQIFAPYGIDPHPDHVAAANAVDLLTRRGAICCRVFEYPRFQAKSAAMHLFRPELRRRLRRVRAADMLGLKRTALAKHRTQCEQLTDEPGWNVLHTHWTRMFFKRYELFVEKDTRQASAD